MSDTTKLKRYSEDAAKYGDGAMREDPEGQWVRLADAHAYADNVRMRAITLAFGVAGILERAHAEGAGADYVTLVEVVRREVERFKRDFNAG